MKEFFLLFLILLLLTFCSNYHTFGLCPFRDLKPINNFNAYKYLGKWYEQVRDKETPFETGECVSAEYILDDEYIRVINSEYLIKNKEIKFVEGKAYYIDPPNAKLLVNFGPDFLNYLEITMGKYLIIDTDYDDYSIVYSCNEIFSFYSMEYIWILTRDKVISNEKYTYLLNKLYRYGFTSERLRERTLQGNKVCVYKDLN